MTPAIGNIVIFTTCDSDDGLHKSCEVPGIITRVHKDGTVSIHTFQESGTNNEIGVKQGKDQGQWNWMPVQE